MSGRLKGYLATLSGVLIISPDAMLLRLISADTLTVMIWRGLGFFAVQWLIVMIIHRHNAMRRLVQTGWTGLVIAIAMAAGQYLFVYAIRNTHAANALVIVAATPLATAALAYFWLGERPGKRTIVTGLTIILALSMTIASGVSFGGSRGDFAALGAVASLAILFTALRSQPQSDMLPAIACCGLISSAGAWLFAPIAAVSSADLPYILLLCLIVSPISFALISIGPKYPQAPEVALLLLAETVLGPFWVWLVMKEVPPPLTMAGGLIMITALACNSWMMFVESPQKKPAHK